MRAMEKYEMGLALNEVEKLFWNFCDNYIELAKNRLYKPEIYGNQAKESAQFASCYVLRGILKLLSIYMPHITEEIYCDAFSKLEGFNSIHNSCYLTPKTQVNEQILAQGDVICDIIAQIRGVKSQAGVSIKTPVESLILTGYEDFVKDYELDILAVGNVQKIEYKQGEKNIDIKLAEVQE